MSTLRSGSPPFPLSVANELMAELCGSITATADKHGLPLPEFKTKCHIAEVLGCGAYGCALPTQDDDCVFKLTADSTEAHFAATAIKLRKEHHVDPRGIVDLRAVFATGKKFEGYHIFAIWRERAIAVGLDDPVTKEFNSCNIKEFGKLLDLLWKTTDEAFRIALSEQHVCGSNSSNYWNWLRERMDLAERLLDGEKGGSKFSNLIAEAVIVIDELERSSGESRQVGKAVREFLQSGILICDLHGNNVGVVERKKKCPMFVVVDPGHALVLNESLAKVDIPLLRA